MSLQARLLQDPRRGAKRQQEPDQEGVPQAGQGDAPGSKPGRPRRQREIPGPGGRLRDALRRGQAKNVREEDIFLKVCDKVTNFDLRGNLYLSNRLAMTGEARRPCRRRAALAEAATLSNPFSAAEILLRAFSAVAAAERRGRRREGLTLS